MLYYSLDIDIGSTEELKGRTNGKNRNPYKFWYILSTIYFLSVVSSKYNRKLHPFINLNAKKLRKVVGRHKLYLDYLIKKGIIECDNHYITPVASKIYKKPVKSKGYRLTEKYKNAKFILCRDDHGLKIDTDKDATEKYIEKCLGGLKINENGLKKCYESMKESEVTRADKIIDLIRNGGYFTTRSKKTGRLFSNITCLNRNLKGGLIFWGKSVSVADVKSCQPAILYSFYQDKTTKEAKKYKDLIESGKFYEFFVENLSSLYHHRDQVKKPFYSLWFGDEDNWSKTRWSHSLKQLKAVFENNFPILWAEMNEMKEDDYAVLARELQRRESNLIFDGVVKWCMEKEIKCLTIHDCILCSGDHVAAVSVRMKEVFDEYTGIKNQIAVENY